MRAMNTSLHQSEYVLVVNSTAQGHSLSEYGVHNVIDLHITTFSFVYAYVYIYERALVAVGRTLCSVQPDTDVSILSTTHTYIPAKFKFFRLRHLPCLALQ